MQPNGEGSSKWINTIHALGRVEIQQHFSVLLLHTLIRLERDYWLCLYLQKKVCKQRLPWTSCICIIRNEENISKTQPALYTLSAVIPAQEGTQAWTVTHLPSPPGKLHTSRWVTAYTFFLKAFRCWGINTAPIASLMAKKPYVWKRKVPLRLLSELFLLKFIISPVLHPITNADC